MSKRLVGCLAAMIVACTKTPGGTPSAKVRPADRIAFAGHGKLFDAAKKPIAFDLAVAAEIQGSLRQVLQEQQVVLDDKSRALVGPAEEMLQKQEVKEDEAVLLRAAILDRYLQHASKEVRAAYGWRNQTIVTHTLRLRPELMERLRDAVRRRLEELGFFDRPDTGTAYMDECRALGVPVPPDWAETGTAWVYQGRLIENLLAGDEYAGVYTYADPAVRGGCIALPRGTGERGSAAGIICQSATTGHACFWDNKLRGRPEEFLGWRGQTLHLADLKDGSNLDSACTGCHVGNNVFRLAPDDPTWTFVMRDPSATGASFTVRIDEGVSPDRQGGKDRYVPYSGPAPRDPPWTNVYDPAPFAGCQSCHEYQRDDPYVPAAMPPLCAGGPRGLDGCYSP